MDTTAILPQKSPGAVLDDPEHVGKRQQEEHHNALQTAKREI
jgi:hypothetical protein